MLLLDVMIKPFWRYNKKKINFLNKLSPDNYFLYLVLLFIHMGLVWLLPYFPTQDGPSHIYNLVILKDLLNGGKEWGNYFTYTLHAVPNLGFNLLSYPMLHLFSPFVVEKLFVSIYIFLMGISVPLFLHTFNNRSLPFIYFVFPVIFNFNLLMGFYSYVVTIPLFLIAFSFSWKIRNGSTACKFVFFNIAGFIIFYFHLIPFVFFVLSLIAITMALFTDLKRKIGELLKLLIIISPSLLIIFLYLTRGPKTLLTDLSYLFSMSHISDLLFDLLCFSTVNISLLQELPACVFTFLVLLFLCFSLKDICHKWRTVGNISHQEKVLIYLVSILILIYLFAPFRLGEGSYFNERFPWVILLIILPLLQIPEAIISKRFVFFTSAIIATLFFAFNATFLWQQSAKVEKFLGGLNVELPKGAYVMTYKKIESKLGWPRVDVLMHATSYYGIVKGYVDIGNYETDLDYFPIHFKDTIPRFPSLDHIAYKAETIDWSDYPAIQYVFAWEVDKNDTEQLSKFFHIIWKEDSFSIWKKTSINLENQF